MRFSEVEVQSGRLEWLIRKDGCMHCEDPGCLKALSGTRGPSSNTPTASSTSSPKTASVCGSCVTGCPFDVPRISKKDSKAYKCSLCSDRGLGGPGARLRESLPDRRDSIRPPREDMKEFAATRIVDLKEARFISRPACTTRRGRGRHRT